MFKLHFNGSNSFLFVNIAKIYQLKAKNSEIKPYPLWSGNISRDFSVNNRIKAELNKYAYEFSVDYILLVLVILSIFINIWWENMV